jgi:hypothetical protein
MELSFENDIGSQNFKFFKKNDYKSFTGSSLRAKPTQCYNLIKTQESHLILLQNKSKELIVEIAAFVPPPPLFFWY